MYNRIYFPDFQFEHNLSEHVEQSAFVNHDHVWYEILYIVTGSGVFLIEDAAYGFAPQSLFLIPLGKYHYMKTLPQDTYDRCVLSFAPALIPNSIPTPPPLFVAKVSDTEKDVLEKFDKYADLFQGEQLRTLYASLLNELLINLSIKKDAYAPEKLQVPPLVGWAIEYVNAHVNEQIRVEELAKRLYCSPSRLQHTFAETMGTSLMRYARMKKMYRARELLQSGAPAQRVCELLGYDDYATFYKTYKSVFHTSPSGKNRK